MKDLHDSKLGTKRRMITAPRNLTGDQNMIAGQLIFLPPNLSRIGEGGLRKQGLLKSVQLNKTAFEEPEYQKRPLVTIITVVFNGAATIRNTIQSVINQDYENIEYIIIDAGSTDGTLDIIREYDDVIDYWVSEPDHGIYDAWNKGVSLAAGEWVAFLGADDTYLDGAIAAYISLISTLGNVQIDYISSRANLVLNSKVLRIIGHKWNWQSFQKWMNVAHVGSLHHKSLFEKYGLYDLSYKVCGDYELLMRPQSKLQAAYLDLITVNMSIGGASDNFSAYFETERAKVLTGGRHPWLSKFERRFAIKKWQLRRLFWY